MESRGRHVLAVFAALLVSCAAQDISGCCDKAVGTCRNVCEKMSLVEIATSSTIRDENLQNIFKFCSPQLIEFWTCMNKTIQDVVSGSEWWGRACCALGRAGACRGACAVAGGAGAVHAACRRSDEVALFECVERQQEARWCCSQTQSLSCHAACKRALWRGAAGERGGESAERAASAERGEVGADVGGAGAGAGVGAERERAADECERSPALLRCMRDLTASTVHTDTAKYLPCCRESGSATCRAACEGALGAAGEAQAIAERLAAACGAPALHGPLWQCFLRTDGPVGATDAEPHDAAKMHCCNKAATINCRRLCLGAFGAGWPAAGRQLLDDCLPDAQEAALAQCVEEVDAPCTLGCSGLTYCSQLNNRPTTLFRSCNKQADLDAHLTVAEHRGSGFVKVAGMELPLKNTTECTSDIWKSVACALHVKPCTPKGHSSLLCMDDCVRLVSACARRGAPSARAVCARLAPRDPRAPCVPLAAFTAHSTSPPLLSAAEAVTSPCAGAPCGAAQLCVVNRGCARGADCDAYTCVDGCVVGGRVVAEGAALRARRGVCRCERGAARCAPAAAAAAAAADDCRLHDAVVRHGEKYYLECNPCACHMGERVCARRACAGDSRARLTRLPCNCPPHHLPVGADVGARHYANACLAKCAGASDAQISFAPRAACPAACPAACVPRRAVCLSRLPQDCPQHVCVNPANCAAGAEPAGAGAGAAGAVCDAQGVTHASACRLARAGRRLAYWGACRRNCDAVTPVCGVNGVSYSSACAAWAEFVSVDYAGPCAAVGPISDLMEPKCQIDRVECPELKKPKCLGFTAPGACCPRCGGALRVLYSKKQIDRALYGTNMSSTVVDLHSILTSLDRFVQIAECALKGYLTVESEIFVTVETVLEHPTDLQLEVCVLEAEKIADLINRESPLISSDLGLSALVYALVVHTSPSAAATLGVSVCLTVMSYVAVLTLK